MLTLKNVRWTVEDGKEILKGIDLTFKTGKLTVITGPNGGGKTSLAKVIAGVEDLSGGQILLDDVDITDKDITERAELGVAFGFQQPVRFKGITVRDMLEIARGGSMTEAEVCDIMDKVGVCAQDYVDRDVDASLSGGEIKRIEIATVLARNDAKLLIFDEPEAGIDLWSFHGLIDAFEELKRGQDKTIIVISHQERLLEIADEIIVIEDGEIKMQGPGSEVLPMLSGDEKGGFCPIGKEVGERLEKDLREAFAQ